MSWNPILNKRHNSLWPKARKLISIRVNSSTLRHMVRLANSKAIIRVISLSLKTKIQSTTHYTISDRNISLKEVLIWPFFKKLRDSKQFLNFKMISNNILLKLLHLNKTMLNNIITLELQWIQLPSQTHNNHTVLQACNMLIHKEPMVPKVILAHLNSTKETLTNTLDPQCLRNLNLYFNIQLGWY